MDDRAAEMEEYAPEHPRDAKPWLDLLADAEKCYEDYQDRADNIDKIYADLKTIATSGDRQFRIFWANLEVLKPSMYSRPPIPVVAPRFKDRRPVPRAAADLLERSLVADFERDDVDTTMRMVRDDLATNARGVAWVRYDPDSEEVPADHVDRRDFRHSPARKWKEVDWVARRSWLTRRAGEARFGEIFLDAKMEQRSIGGDEDGDYKGEKKAEVWEMWHKGAGLVVWVSPGMDEVLDIREPWLQLEGFFPCPRPAYGTLQRSTLIPVPDFVYYKDQVEEINELTGRIAALSDALRMKGYYPSGASDVADAVAALLKDDSNKATLVGIANFGALGGASLKDSIVWLPVMEVANTIASLVELRRQLIDDVYQITGLSDIMRGSTVASETLGAQQLKSQYGSIRIKDRQEELIRMARDITRLKAEIMAENFRPESLLELSQVDDLPTQEEIQQQVQQLQAAAQQSPEAAQQLQEIGQKPTLDAVMALLREQRVRPFVLEIETDSTIQPNEDAEKQRRNEFMQALGGFLATAGPIVQQEPATAPFVAEALKFVVGGYRAGRQMDTAIDEFAEQIKGKAKQGDPAQQAAAQAQQMEMQAKQAEAQMKGQEAQAKMQQAQTDAQIRMQEHQADMQAKAAEAQIKAQEGQLGLEKLGLEIEKLAAEIEKIRAAPVKQPAEAANAA